ncbi:MAG TPA: sigma 54-interacting transcriptional regulator [Sandaracinaceae bacterium LLY-WYZ-13_1]|nr:sigma 54-interacting transcriptional regulator [Sandaracinaceae bacterium LLY-WYZ-13_1]
MPDRLPIAHLAREDVAVQDLMRRGLDWLATVAPYDLATIFELVDAELVVQAARGRFADERVSGHRIALADFPTVREAIETRRARAYTEHDHRHGDGDPFDGVLDLPAGHACMVVPLTAGQRTLGVLTLDRGECETYADATVELVELYGRLLALAIHNAHLRAEVERLSERRRQHAAELERRLSGEGAGELERSAAPAVRRLAVRAQQVARTDTPVLIRGETGTGKERLAHAIHAWSPRAEGPFVAVNCAAIPPALLESELFGHEKGAFTGATAARAGRFRIAQGGTLFLDEIGELPQELQAKLLRAVQQGEVQPVGSDRAVSVDVRLVAATHVDLEAAIRDGRFREDLFYRLSVFPLHLPPLRERLEDLPELCDHLLGDIAARTGWRGLHLGDDALDALRAHPWPGNVRELANVLERAAIVTDGEIRPEELALPAGAAPSRPAVTAGPEAPLPTLTEVEIAHIEAALRRTGGKIYGDDGAATILGLKPTTLQSRMKKHGIDRRAAAEG